MKQTIGRFLLQPNKNFPVDCETLEALQTNIALLQVLGNLAGDKAVLLGCEPEQNGTRRKAGYVFLKTKDSETFLLCLVMKTNLVCFCIVTFLFITLKDHNVLFNVCLIIYSGHFEEFHW